MLMLILSKMSSRTLRLSCHAFAFHNHAIKPSITPNNPNPMPAISFPPVAAPLPDAEGVAEVVGLLVDEAVAAGSSVCPRLGSFALPLTIQPLTVEVGHAGGERCPVDAL